MSSKIVYCLEEFMDNIGVFVLVLRGFMAVALLAFTAIALIMLWKDLTNKSPQNPDKKGKVQRREQQ